MCEADIEQNEQVKAVVQKLIRAYQDEKNVHIAQIHKLIKE